MRNIPAAVAGLERLGTTSSSTLDPKSAGAAKQSAALARDGLDQPVPFASGTTTDKEPTGYTFTTSQIQSPVRPKKLSFRDTVARAFGRKNSATFEGHFSITSPWTGDDEKDYANPNADAGKTVKMKIAPLTPITVKEDIAAGSQLPNIPIDPKLNKKDAQAQSKRMRALQQQDAQVLRLGTKEGTYGRSASMDVPRPSNIGAGIAGRNGSETALTRSDSKVGTTRRGFMGLVRGNSSGGDPGYGYASDSDAVPRAAGLGKMFGLGRGIGGSGSGGSERPPVSAATRYGKAGIGGIQSTSSRDRKWSLGRSASTPTTTGGFFQHREYCGFSSFDR